MFIRVTATREPLPSRTSIPSIENELPLGNMKTSEITKVFTDGVPIYFEYETSCREGLLYEAACSLSEMEAFRSSLPYIIVEIETLYEIDKFSKPFLETFYDTLKKPCGFDYHIDDECKQVYFRTYASSFNVPLYSCLLHLAIYSHRTFEEITPKARVEYSDLYDIVDGLVSWGYTDEYFLGFAIWNYLRKGEWRVFRFNDGTYGNSLSGIAHHIEERLRRGYDMPEFFTFIKKYHINPHVFGNWLHYIISMNDKFPFEDWVRDNRPTGYGYD